ncbi:hypothetical protein N6H14_33230 [Paenibacillus sp. CC-CFT747]|nr:hypothetical protein N6H14_33230 [Paenibacillus sp. CC-CFT747]
MLAIYPTSEIVLAQAVLLGFLASLTIWSRTRDSRMKQQLNL